MTTAATDHNANTGQALRTFLACVLPEGGHHCAVTIPRRAGGRISAGVKHYWTHGVDALAAKIEQLHALPGRGARSIYFAPASYSSAGSRKADNVAKVKALWLDIDAGADKLEKGQDVYPGQKEAIAAVAAFVKAAGARPSYIVSSGAGLHVYWCLEEAIAPTEWRRLASALRRQCEAHGLKADHSCTTDPARILRPPGTTHPSGAPVGIVWGDGARTYTPEQMASALQAAPAESSGEHDEQVPDYLRNVPSLSLDLHDAPTSSALKIAQKCPALAHVAATKGCVPEPYWRAMLGLVKHTTEGRDIAHEWSSGHPDYSDEATDKKLDGWSAAPTTCTEFAKYTQACASCPHRGRITSPIQLGEGGHTSGALVPAPEALRATLPDVRKDPSGRITRVLPTSTNLAALAGGLGISIGLNLMTRQVDITIPDTSCSADAQNTRLQLLGDILERASISRMHAPALASTVANQNPFHPVARLLEHHPWDGTSRLEAFHRTLRVRPGFDETLAHAVVDAWALQCIAALGPTGFASQGVLVLQGGQGVGKTRWVASLMPDSLVAGAVRTGVALDPSDKDSVWRATGAWVCELGELDATTSKADTARLKAFITAPEDVQRRPYQAAESRHPRRTVFVGTVNGSGFLHDETGNRRFWVIPVLSCTPLPTSEMVQVWSEYHHLYKQGRTPYLDCEHQEALAASNDQFQMRDPIEEQIACTWDWRGWSGAGKPESATEWMTATRIAEHLHPGAQPSKATANRCAAVVRALNGGMERRTSTARVLAVPRRGVTWGKAAENAGGQGAGMRDQGAPHA